MFSRPLPYAQLKQAYEALLVRFEKLEAENQSLKEENIRLVQQVKELKDRLGLNSKNSGIPSSKELYKLKRARAKSGRKAGGQMGHPGKSRPMEQADKIVAIPLQKQCHCRGKIEKLSKPYILQKIEIPPITPFVTEYQLAQGRCQTCNKYYRAPLPAGVTPDLLAPRAKAIIASLSGFFKNSKTQVQSIMRDIFNLPLSLATICKTEHRISEKLKPSYYQLLINQKKSEQLHIDETSHQQKGKKGWGWIFCNKNQSVIKLAYTRGRRLLERYLKNYEGIAISDRYGVYNRFKKRQICWSHLARDFERLAHSKYEKICTLGQGLSQISREEFLLHRLFLKEALSENKYKARLRKLRKRMRYYLKESLKVGPQEGPQLQRIASNIKKIEVHVWRFYDNPRQIPLTNNLAERQLRHYVVYRKTSFFTWSDKGDRFLERIISLFLTWRQQLLNPFDQLLLALNAP